MTDIKSGFIDEQLISSYGKLDNISWKNLNISEYSLNKTYINSRECPHCGSHEVVSKGNYKGRKRYQCHNCGKSYNDLTKTPLSGIHYLNKIKIYLDCMISGDSIRKAAKIVHISVPTSFRWRHRILNTINRLPSPRMKNVKEVMELELPYSHKGQKFELTPELRRSKISAVFICDRMGKVDSDSIDYNRRYENPVIKRVREASNEHTDIMISPKYINIMKKSEFNLKSQHSPYSSTLVVENIITIWKKWMQRFHGIASKYLSNYLHWFDFLDNTLYKNDRTSKLLSLIMGVAHSKVKDIPMKNNLYNFLEKKSKMCVKIL